MVVPATYGFVFQAQELPHKLSQTSKDILKGMPTGYWICEFPAASPTSSSEQNHIVYVALLRGRIIFSGHQQLTWPDLLKALQRYVPRLRSNHARHTILALERKLISDQQESRSTVLLKLLSELHKQELVSTKEVSHALRLKILSDFDAHLFDRPGRAQFLPSPQIYTQAPISGFELDTILADAQERQTLWRKLQVQIPSMDDIPVLNAEAVMQSHLSVEQRQRLENLVLNNRSLSDIASMLAQDPLEIAKGFAKLINEGLVTLKSPESFKTPEIIIVDDSPLILKQFKNLVTNWGYRVKLSQNPAAALQIMLASSPAAIFLDINMPEITGFDLVKQIRRQPELASVPLVMLTAEKTLSNNWRAQWSGCRFLTKPLASQEVPQFQLELRKLLKELAPIPTSTQF